MMKQSIAIGLFFAASMASAFRVCAADTIVPASDSKPLAVVGVYARHVGDKIVYHYRVTNNSQLNITAVTIGHNDQNDGNPGNDINELASLPSGWTAKLGIPSTSSNGPTGWRVSVVAPEDNVTHAIAWEPLSDHSPQIHTGQTLNKMSISLDKADSSYLSGHALVTFDDEGKPTTLTVSIEQLDITPPSLTVILDPDTIMSQTGKFVPIKASFMLKDDYDRFPEIRLESITANEFLGTGDIRDASYGLDDRYFKLLAESRTLGGRVYTVTYSATDASGNQTIASANVTVTKPVDTPGATPAQ
ncbi:MAG: hypothetical protein WCA64_11035 [Gallionella sp.]